MIPDDTLTVSRLIELLQEDSIKFRKVLEVPKYRKIIPECVVRNVACDCVKWMLDQENDINPDPGLYDVVEAVRNLQYSSRWFRVTVQNSLLGLEDYKNTHDFIEVRRARHVYETVSNLISYNAFAYNIILTDQFIYRSQHGEIVEFQRQSLLRHLLTYQGHLRDLINILKIRQKQIVGIQDQFKGKLEDILF
jgi:hypothetical protein